MRHINVFTIRSSKGWRSNFIMAGYWQELSWLMRWCTHGSGLKVCLFASYSHLFLSISWIKVLHDVEQAIPIWSPRWKKAYAKYWLTCGWILRCIRSLEVVLPPHLHHRLHLRRHHLHHRLLPQHLQRKVNDPTSRRNLGIFSNTRSSRIHHRLMEMDFGKGTRLFPNMA